MHDMSYEVKRLLSAHRGVSGGIGGVTMACVHAG